MDIIDKRVAVLKQASKKLTNLLDLDPLLRLFSKRICWMKQK